jgi:hypothetical protein
MHCAKNHCELATLIGGYDIHCHPIFLMVVEWIVWLDQSSRVRYRSISISKGGELSINLEGAAPDSRATVETKTFKLCKALIEHALCKLVNERVLKLIDMTHWDLPKHQPGAGPMVTMNRVRRTEGQFLTSFSGPT